MLHSLEAVESISDDYTFKPQYRCRSQRSSYKLSVCKKMSDENLSNVNEILIERLKIFSCKPNENIESIRSVAAKLHSRTASQDRNVRDKTLERIWRKNDGVLGLIVSLLETVRDHITACSLAGILHECVSSKAGKHRNPAVTQLVAMNCTQSLVKLLHSLQIKESQVSDNLIQEIVCILSQLSQKDSKFSLKVRLLYSVKTFHLLLRLFYNNTKLLFPLLLIMKSLARNPITTSVLVKDGIVSTLEKVIISIGFSPNSKLRLALNVLRYLSRNKLCCTKVMKTGLFQLILRIFERWDRYDGKMRLKLCNYSLITLQNISCCKLGRKVIRNNNGLAILHKFCVSCPEDKAYDPLLSRVCHIINTCLERKQLPLGEMSSPATFGLPLAQDYYDYDSPTQTGKKRSSRETTPTSDDDSGDDSRDEDDDDDDEGIEQERGDEGYRKIYELPTPVVREIEDLKQYTSCFSELIKSNTSIVVSNQDSLSVDNKYLKIKPVDSTSCPDFKLFCDKNLDNLDFSNMSPKISTASFYTFNVSDGSETTVGKLKTGNLNSLKNVHSTRKNSRQSNANLNSTSKVLSIFSEIPKNATFEDAYCRIASQVQSVLPFTKVAYPDMVGGNGVGRLEPLNIKDRRICRAKLMNCVERGLHPNSAICKVVFDIDNNSQSGSRTELRDNLEKKLINNDEGIVRMLQPGRPSLSFESRFESGNLRKVIQIGQREYDLILMPDVNSTKHHQWFYFEVSSMEANLPYTFNIINCEKQNSQFNYGMKPIMYSVREAVEGRPGWVRIGTDICYYRNSYSNPSNKTRAYLTTTFSITFQHQNDVCYIAYHFPYTYSLMMTHLWRWQQTVNPSLIYFRVERLCLSLNNNETPVLTISAPESDNNSFEMRELIFLTSRVHPGESNASWVMQGTLEYLLSDSPSASKLRNKYIFKIVPMLNLDGVINGCHRCGLTNEDLNRRWSRPNPVLHPVIYHTKGLLEYCTRVLKKPPYVFCDYHGHSRRKNVFLYGCSNADSWYESDQCIPDNPVDYLMLPHLMQHFCPAFSLPLCNFRVERGRESTARVTVWREFGIKRSYTMESSYCGCDQGLYQGFQIDTIHLKEIGSHFCDALACLQEESAWRSELLLANRDSGRPYELFPTTSIMPVMISNSSDDTDDSSFSDYENYHLL